MFVVNVLSLSSSSWTSADDVTTADDTLDATVAVSSTAPLANSLKSDLIAAHITLDQCIACMLYVQTSV